MPRRRYAGREGQAPEGLRSLRSLRPLPSSSASSLRDNLLPKGPSPCPCPGVDTPSGAWPSALLPTMAIIPPGQNAGMVIFLMNVVAAGGCCGRRSLLQDVVVDECLCGRMLLWQDVVVAGTGRHSGGFLLRIMPPSWHPVPACTPTTALQADHSILPQRRLESDADLVAATTVAGGTILCCRKENQYLTRTSLSLRQLQAEPFSAAAKIRIGRGSRCCHASCRLAVLLCRSED